MSEKVLGGESGMSMWKRLAENYHKRAVRMTELYEGEFKKNYELSCLIDELYAKLKRRCSK